jgi:MoaA/NifB/PqqE/SkfB family radical SAM enzyme
MKRLLIKLLTASLPLKLLRKIYIYFSFITSWWKYGDYKFPRIISIEINTHCNRACSYCPNIIYPQSPKLIKKEVMAKLADRLGDINYSGVVDFIFFSEPMLNRSLPEYVKMVKKAAPKSIPRICTNGDLLTHDNVQELISSGLERIYAMRHNPTPIGWREKMSRLKAAFPGNIIVMDIDEVERVEGLHDFNGLLEVKKHRGRNIVKGTARCQVHRHVMQITIDGDWDLCCVDYAKTYKFGSLLERSIMDIWKDPAFVAVRKTLEAGEPATEVCKTCTCLVVRKPEHTRVDFVPREGAPTKLPKIKEYSENESESKVLSL